MKYFKQASIIFFALGFLLVCIAFFSYVDKNQVNHEPLPQKITGLRQYQSLEFAGEQVPIKNPDVAERLEREMIINTYQHTSTLLHLKLASRYLPRVEQIFKEEGIPDDLKYLAVAESSLRNAVSSAGAKGIWQFRDAAAKDLGLTINDYVDERNHFEKSTRAACKYLRQLKSKFNTWSLACAAYNMGPGALASSLNEQGESSYYDLNLNDETNRYVFRIIAIKEIMKSPEQYGYYLNSADYYAPHNQFKEITIDSSITSLSDFAHQQGITYRKLKVFNPWLLKNNLPNKNKTSFTLRIPKE